MHAILTNLKARSLRRWVSQLLLISLVSLVATVFVRPAAAAGRVVWKKTTINEHTKKEAWYLELEIHLPRAPDVGQKGMKFEFTPVAEFERSLVDGREEPQERTIPLSKDRKSVV